MLSKIKSPRVLEVGIDKGITMFPLVTAMAGMCESFSYVGIDVKIQESVDITLKLMPQPIPNSTWLFEKNSLDVLPDLVEQGMKFDLILLDGDHNYHTVSKELEYAESLLADNGIMIIDDYDGKWSDRDLWYADRPGYESNEFVTKPVDSEKHGVKPAVDDWLARVGWHKAKPIQGEPIVVSKRPLQVQAPPQQPGTLGSG